MKKIDAIALAALLFMAVSPVLADVSKQASAGIEKGIPAPAPVTHCKWPAQIPLLFDVSQLQVLGAWATGQDYSHHAWESMSSSITPQFAALTAKYCSTGAK